MKILLFLFIFSRFKNESVRVPSPVNKCFEQLNPVFDKSFIEGEMLDLDKVKHINNNEVGLEQVDKFQAYQFEIQHEKDNEDSQIRLRVSNRDPELIKVSSEMFEDGDIAEKLEIQDQQYVDIKHVQSEIYRLEQEHQRAANDLQEFQQKFSEKQNELNGINQKKVLSESDIQTQQKLIENLEKQKAEGDSDAEAIQQQIESATSAKQTAEENKKSAEGDLSIIQVEYDQMSEQLKEKRDKTEELHQEKQKFNKIRTYLEVEQDQLSYCVIQNETENICNSQYNDLKMTELSDEIAKFEINTIQDSMRGVLSRLQLTTGKLYTWNNIKFEFDKSFTAQSDDRPNVKLDKGFIPLTSAIKSLTNSVSTKRADILNNMMITSLIFKKVLVLLETASGIRNFQCPPGQGQEVNENINENQNNMDTLFVENSINFDFLTKNQLEYEMHVRDYVNKQKISTIKQDLEKGNSNELYNPSFEVKNIMAHQDSALPKSDIHTLNRPLEKLSRHNPTEDNTLACTSGMMRDFPILVPFLTEEMLGFQTKEEGGQQNFELLFYYKKYGVRRVNGRLELTLQQFFQEDLTNDNYINDSILFYQENGMLERIPTFLEKLLALIEEALQKLKDILSSLFGFKKKQKKQDPTEVVQENNNMTKGIEDVAIKANINYLYKDFQINGETVSDDFSFVEPYDAIGVVDLMVDQRLIIDTIIDKYLDEKEKYIATYYEEMNKDRQQGQPERKFVYQFEFDIYKIEALIKINQFRLMTYLFRRLKFSPMVLPEGFELLQQKSYQNLYQQNDQINGQVEKEISAPNKIELNIHNDKLHKKEIPATFQNTIQMTEKLSQDTGNRFKSKKHLVYSSFVKFMQNFLKKNFDSDADLAACLVPHENMQRGNKCPIFLKDYIKTISENPHNKIEFNSMYNLFFDYFETNPETLEISVNEFVDQMFNFSRFFRNKENFQMGMLDTISIIRNRVLESTRNEKLVDKIEIVNIKDPNVEKQYRSLVYSATLEDVGLVYPEFKYTSLEFLFTMLDAKIEIDENNKDIDFKQEIKEKKAQNEREFQKLKQQLQDLRQDIGQKRRILI